MAKGQMNINDKVQFRPTLDLLRDVNRELEGHEKFITDDLGYLNIRLWEFAKYFGNYICQKTEQLSDKDPEGLVTMHTEPLGSSGIKDNTVYVQVEFIGNF